MNSKNIPSKKNISLMLTVVLVVGIIVVITQIYASQPANNSKLNHDNENISSNISKTVALDNATKPIMAAHNVDNAKSSKTDREIVNYQIINGPKINPSVKTHKSGTKHHNDQIFRLAKLHDDVNFKLSDKSSENKLFKTKSHNEHSKKRSLFGEPNNLMSWKDFNGHFKTNIFNTHDQNANDQNANDQNANDQNANDQNANDQNANDQNANIHNSKNFNFGNHNNNFNNPSSVGTFGNLHSTHTSNTFDLPFTAVTPTNLF
ncbi:MAG TPA: hypothetical protein VN704_06325 [Verrucomicrobiae bacterium]|nr:hypothetical protein [Verrucomicrobiae bacterium]